MKKWLKSSRLSQKLIGGLIALSAIIYLFYGIATISVGTRNRVGNTTTISAVHNYLAFIKKHESKETAQIKEKITDRQTDILEAMEGNFTYRKCLVLEKEFEYLDDLFDYLTYSGATTELKEQVITTEKIGARYDLVNARNALSISRGNTAISLFSTFLQLAIVEGILAIGLVMLPKAKSDASTEDNEISD